MLKRLKLPTGRCCLAGVCAFVAAEQLWQRPPQHGQVALEAGAIGGVGALQSV
jgi:hypothetical protein